MKEQRIRVNTKGGLLTAFECCKDFCGITNIILVRSTGESEYIIRYNFDVLILNISKIHVTSEEVFNKWVQWINKAKSKIRKIPAKELLS